NKTKMTFYHYYKDKDRLFQEISLDCLYELNECLVAASKEGKSVKEQIQNAIESFRDWSFENPRRALLVMQGIKSADDASPEMIEEYYVCNRTGEKLLNEAIKQGIAVSSNPRLDVSILVSGLWGCIESVLLKKCEADYWDNGKLYTDRFINLWLNSVFGEDKNR
ncbi:MAG: TetR/AcrR family transcriptional regulator, partial [Spirochaetaceae bacterium]|nr:TetR/AcrR family transcriptional regulator [Spirochaetaceae bacterium]